MTAPARVAALFLTFLPLIGLGLTSFASAAPPKVAIPNPGQKATVLVFIAHDCPISNSYTKEISRIATDYAKRGVKLSVVYAEDNITQAKAREHARQFGLTVPVVLDTKHRLSASTGATVTPEAAIFNPAGNRLYLGRIDNRYIGYGKTRNQATVRDLRVALDAVLASKPVPQATTTAIGCFIPDPH